MRNFSDKLKSSKGGGIHLPLKFTVAAGAKPPARFTKNKLANDEQPQNQPQRVRVHRR